MADWKTIPGFVMVGKLGKTHGAEGELRVHADETVLLRLLRESFLFVDIDGSKVPLQVESWREARGALVAFHDITDATQAAQLTGSPLYLPEGDFKMETANTSILEYGGLAGFSISDKSLGLLGTIESVVDYPQQEMARVHLSDREVLIPMNPVFIAAIDEEKRMVIVDLPDGLLDQ